MISTTPIAAVNPNFGQKSKDLLRIDDLSQQPRCGVKGPGAADWLSALGLTLPNTPNSWLALPDGGLIARLGNSEYLLEGDASLVQQVQQTARSAGVYPVLRQDTALLLAGSRVGEMLLQICNIDFRCLAKEPSQVILTSMAGVGVTVLRADAGTQPIYRVWCDGTYGRYLRQTLGEIATELGGDALAE